MNDLAPDGVGGSTEENVMWVFLSRRLRTWVLLAIAVPLVRRVLQRITEARARSHPDARSTAALRHADSALGRVQDRRRGKRRR